MIPTRSFVTVGILMLFATLLLCGCGGGSGGPSGPGGTPPVVPSGWILQNPHPTTNRLYASFVLGDSTGIAVGELGTIVTTSDGGNSWQAVASGVTVDLFDVAITGFSSAMVVGKEGTILRTTDAGAT